jgi:hypothetical protein
MSRGRLGEGQLRLSDFADFDWSDRKFAHGSFVGRDFARSHLTRRERRQSAARAICVDALAKLAAPRTGYWRVAGVRRRDAVRLTLR